MSCLDNIYSDLKSTEQLAETKASSMCLKARLQERLEEKVESSAWLHKSGEFSGFYATSDSKSQEQIKTQRNFWSKTFNRAAATHLIDSFVAQTL